MTPRQKQLYDIIKADLDATGICPSFEEMRERMGLASRSAIPRILLALEEQGHIPVASRSALIMSYSCFCRGVMPPP